MMDDEARVRRFLHELDLVQPSPDLERRVLAPRERRSRSRRPSRPLLQLAAVVGIVLLAVLVVATMLLIPRPRSVTPAAPGKIVRTYSEGVGGEATGGSLSVSQGRLWIANRGTGTVVGTDPDTGKTQKFDVGEDVTSVLASDDFLWVGRLTGPRQDKGDILRLDVKTGRVLQTIALPHGPSVLYVAGDSLWVSTAGPHMVCPCNEIYRVNWQTGAILARITVPTPLDMAVTPGAVWVTGNVALLRIDPETNQVVATVPDTTEPAGVAVAGRWIWTGKPFTDTVLRIDPQTNRVVGRVDLKNIKNSPLHLLAVGDSLWVTSSAGLYRVNSTTGVVEGLVATPETCQAITASEGSIWCAGRDATYRIQPLS